MLFFPIECGREYQEEQFLRQVIDRQRIAQHRLNSEQPSDARPQTAIAAATIISKLTAQGHREFYAHFPVPVPIPPCDALPAHVIGFHEHDEGYTYAVLTLEKQEVDIGKLDIPLHVQQGARAQHSDNYVFEIANAMVKLGLRHNALLGLEDTSWKKRWPSLDRCKNRRTFARPSMKLAEVLAYKALLAGLLPLRLTPNVSPTRDCSKCGMRLDKGKTGVLPKLKVFTCQACNQRRLADENTAVVVAQRTLEQLVRRSRKPDIDNHYSTSE